MSVRTVLCGLVAGAMFVGLGRAGAPASGLEAASAPAASSRPAMRYLAGVRYAAPEVVRVAIPEFPGMFAIWGATGCDARGHVWFAVCGHSRKHPTAHLFEYVPTTGKVIDRGDVVSQLKLAGVYREGEMQMKIHSRIIPADDGHLYFASMDENDENQAREIQPTWGGHMWRYRIRENRWDHLLATDEPLIAAAGAGRYFYALGYFGHVVYQYDRQTGKHRRLKVGSMGGHISRNIIADARGHVYVPRVKAGKDKRPVATLVELDTSLKEVAETPLKHYLTGSPMYAHGIIALQPMPDGSTAFLTHGGYLSLVVPRGDRPARLRNLGWFHPGGRSYISSLFGDASGRYLMGVAKRRRRNYEWVVYDLETRKSRVLPFEIRGEKGLWHGMSTVFGSATRDPAGNFYAGGKEPVWGGGSTPIVLQITPRREAVRHRRPEKAEE